MDYKEQLKTMAGNANQLSVQIPAGSRDAFISMVALNGDVHFSMSGGRHDLIGLLSMVLVKDPYFADYVLAAAEVASRWQERQNQKIQSN